MQNRFSIMTAKDGRELNEILWGNFVKSGLHIEQAMVVSRPPSLEGSCVDAKCGGKVVSQAVGVDRHRKVW